MHSKTIKGAASTHPNQMLFSRATIVAPSLRVRYVSPMVIGGQRIGDHPSLQTGYST